MKIRFALAAVSIALAGPAMAQIVQNGGFEAPSIGTNPYVAYYPATQGILGWTVGGESVDLINTTYGPFPQGVQALDLNGFGPGSISQALSLVAGETYVLSFLYSNNGGGTGTGTVSVGNLSTSLSHSGGGSPYTLFVQSFVAGSTTAANTLTFTSTNGGSGGLFLDAISVSPAPEPATWAMMIGGFGMAGVALRRRRRTAKRVFA